MVAAPRNQFNLLIHKGLLAHSSPFVFRKRSRRVQNFSQLGRYPNVVFLRHVAVDTQSHLGIAVSEPLLPQFLLRQGSADHYAVTMRNALGTNSNCRYQECVQSCPCVAYKQRLFSSRR
jgi:hypothetical protein